MKNGSIDCVINKVLLYGAAGTGKSSFLDMITGTPPRNIRVSTSLASRPFQVFHLDTANDDWAMLSLNSRKEILARAAMVPLAEDEDSTPSEDEQEAASHHPHSEGHTEEDLSSTHNSPTPKLQTDQYILQDIATCNDLVLLLEQASQTSKPITAYRKLYLIDLGGHPHFHEILPAFLRRTTLCVFMFKLSEEFATKPTVEFYDNSGHPVGTPFQSSHTNEQLLKHCLRTLHTHRASSKSEGKASRVMVVGTHRDKEVECTTESREEKNRKLAEILLPPFKDEVLFFNAYSDELIFPVNTKDPQEDDVATVQKIRQLILTASNPNPVRVPLQYFALEILLEEASKSLKRGILSIEECLQVARELHFDKHTLALALQFLNDLSVVLYFPEVLEGVVFADPQVLLDKVMELVQASNQTIDTSYAHSAEWKIFIDHALFDLEFLYQKEFQRHYVSGLFSPTDLVKLFRRLLVIADFSEGKLFMPALLPVLEEEKVHKHRVSADSPAAALALDFPLGGPRLGTFCTLACFLVSHHNQFPCPWKIVLLPGSNTPACLYRNCVKYSVPRFPGTVTLIDTFTHFEVHVNTSPRVVSKLCNQVRQAIFTGLKQATLTLGYNDSIPSAATLCPCSVGSVHIARTADGVWTCIKDPAMFGDLETQQLIWEDYSPVTFSKGMYAIMIM